MTGIDFKTYKGDAGVGGIVNLARPANALALAAQGTSVFWVRARSKKDGFPVPVAAPTVSPEPAAQTAADGWIRVDAAGNPPSGSATGAGFPAAPGVPFIFPEGQQVTALEIWCAADGAAPFLAIIATQ